MKKKDQLPAGVLRALAFREKAYCDQFLGDYRKGCHKAFRANLLARNLVITPSGRTAFLVESKNLGDCGSAGCALFLFTETSDGKFSQILAAEGEAGKLRNIQVLKSVTRGHFDIQKTWVDEKSATIYQWDGERYSAR